MRWGEGVFIYMLKVYKVHLPVYNQQVVRIRPQVSCLNPFGGFRLVVNIIFWDLRCRSAAARLLRLRVRIPPGAWLDVCCECCPVEVSAWGWSLVQGSPTECGASLCMIQKPREWGGHGPRLAAAPQETKKKVWGAGYRFIKNMYEVDFGVYRPPNDRHFICSLNRKFCLSAFLIQVYPTNNRCTT
jgi:hypothetical protein